MTMPDLLGPGCGLDASSDGGGDGRDMMRTEDLVVRGNTEGRTRSEGRSK
jgi:hypothetical protein